MNITTENCGPAAILNIQGELTLDSLDGFKRAVEHAMEDKQTHDIVLNLEAVEFVDSAGWEYLLELQEKLTERLGQVKLAKAGPTLAKILEITRLDTAFDRYDEVLAATKTL